MARYLASASRSADASVVRPLRPAGRAFAHQRAGCGEHRRDLGFQRARVNQGVEQRGARERSLKPRPACIRGPRRVRSQNWVFGFFAKQPFEVAGTLDGRAGGGNPFSRVPVCIYYKLAVESRKSAGDAR
jgi:hypothetical protein